MTRQVFEQLATFNDKCLTMFNSFRSLFKSDRMPYKSDLEEMWDNIDGASVRPVTVIIVGCGQRGQNYAAFALDFPSRMKVVGVAEPVAHRRHVMMTRYQVPEQSCVQDWRVLAETGTKIADAVMVCTQDKDHKVF